MNGLDHVIYACIDLYPHPDAVFSNLVKSISITSIDSQSVNVGEFIQHAETGRDA